MFNFSRKAFLFLSVLPMFSPSFADEASSWHYNCSAVASIAEEIMKNRQVGVSLPEMMNAVQDSELKNLAETLIILAYDEPRYSTAEMRRRAAEDFRDNSYLECAKVSRE